MPTEKILIVDDEQSMTQFLGIVLRKEGYQVTTVNNGRDALEKVKVENFDVVITDIKMPGMDGIQLLQGIKKHDPQIPVVIMTAYASQQSAIDAVNLGAFQYLIKNAKNDEIKLVVRNAIEMRKVRAENQYLKRELKKGHEEKVIIGTSDEMVRVFKMVGKVADSEATIMIQGESGTGKELIANAIHYHSPRATMPIIKVSCASLSEGIIESELFGHEKGAFTGAILSRKGRFELAHNGTLFLDEVEDIPPATQIKLLRVLQEGEFERAGGNKTIRVNIRIIAASNRDLQEEVKRGLFREDLFYRLNVVTIKLPPLRERRDDIPFLVNFFIDKYNQKYSLKVKGISQRAMNLLTNYEWSGNVRELENTLESVLVVNNPHVIDIGQLPPEIREFGEKPEVIPIRIGTSLEDVEREVLIQTLKATKGNKRKAAQLLGINVRTIHRKIEEFGGDDFTS